MPPVKDRVDDKPTSVRKSAVSAVPVASQSKTSSSTVKGQSVRPHPVVPSSGSKNTSTSGSAVGGTSKTALVDRRPSHKSDKTEGSVATVSASVCSSQARRSSVAGTSKSHAVDRTFPHSLSGSAISATCTSSQKALPEASSQKVSATTGGGKLPRVSTGTTRSSGQVLKSSGIGQGGVKLARTESQREKADTSTAPGHSLRGPVAQRVAQSSVSRLTVKKVVKKSTLESSSAKKTSVELDRKSNDGSEVSASTSELLGDSEAVSPSDELHECIAGDVDSGTNSASGEHLALAAIIANCSLHDDSGRILKDIAVTCVDDEKESLSIESPCAIGDKQHAESDGSCSSCCLMDETPVERQQYSSAHPMISSEQFGVNRARCLSVSSCKSIQSDTGYHTPLCDDEFSLDACDAEEDNESVIVNSTSDNSISLWDKDEQNCHDVTVIQCSGSPSVSSTMEGIVDDCHRVSQAHHAGTSDDGVPKCGSVVADCVDRRRSDTVELDASVDCTSLDLLDAVEKLCAELNNVVTDPRTASSETVVKSVELASPGNHYEDAGVSEAQLADVLSEIDVIINSRAVVDKVSAASNLTVTSTTEDSPASASHSHREPAVPPCVSTASPSASEHNTPSASTFDCVSAEDGRKDPVITRGIQVVSSNDVACSADVRSVDNLSDKSVTKTLPKQTDGRIVMVTEIPPVSVVKFRPVATKEYFNVNNSTVKLNHHFIEKTPKQRQSAGGDTASGVENAPKDTNHNVVLNGKDDSESSHSVPPPMAPSSCMSNKRPQSSTVELVSSRHPLSQLYGDRGVTTQPSNFPSASSSASSMPNRKSMTLTQGPSPSLSSGGQVTTSADGGGDSSADGVMSQIRLARSCSRNSVSGRLPSQESSKADDTTRRRRVEQYRGGVVSMLASDWRSTPWLPTSAGDSSTCSSSSFYFPSQSLSSYAPNGQLSRTSPLRMTMSTTGLQWMSPSVTPTSSLTSSPCQTPTVSRSSSSIISHDGSTLHASSTVNDEDSLRGSITSLTSLSSVCSTVEERQALEIRKLRQELEVAHEKMDSLSSQLNANSMISTSYEQSVTTLTKKLRQLAEMLDKKDVEVNELRTAIKAKGSGDVDLETIPDCVSLGSFQRKSTNSNTLPNEGRSSGNSIPQLSRHISCESVDSMNSQSSANSMSSHQSAMFYGDKKKMKKKNWIKNSLAKAFSMTKKNSPKLDSVSMRDADSVSLQSDISSSDFAMDSIISPAVRTADCFAIERPMFTDSTRANELEDQLHRRDVELTESRLQSLASFQQIEQLQENISSLEKEVASLKAENKNLKRLLLRQGSVVSVDDDVISVGQSSQDGDSSSVTMRQRTPAIGRLKETRCLSLGSSFHSSLSPSSPPGSHMAQKYSLSDVHQDFETSSDFIRNIKVKLSSSELIEVSDDNATRLPPLIGELSLTRLTSWRSLDSMVTDVFMEYVHQIDPGSHLGLNADSVMGFRFMEITRMINGESPDLLPANYISDADVSIEIIIKGWEEDSLDALVLETVTPKSSLQQYVSLLMESRRLVFSGPTGTGKTYLASKIAKHIVQRCKKSVKPHDIVTFAVDSMSVRDLQQYIARLVRQCDAEDVDTCQLPTVIVVDNLQHVTSLSDVLSGFVACKSPACPYFVATMTQTRTPSAADLQLRQKIRWVLLSSPLEPVSGLLSRYLRRRIIHAAAGGNSEKPAELNRIVDWLLQVWQHVNKFTNRISSSASFSIGPAQFLSCPMELKLSQIWFTDLWNNGIIPYLTQVIKDTCGRLPGGGTSHAHQSGLEDPTNWVLESFPWSKNGISTNVSSSIPALLRVNLDGDTSATTVVSQSLSTSLSREVSATSTSSSDPLLTMLMKLQEVSVKPLNANNTSMNLSTTYCTNSVSDRDLCRYGDGLAAVGSAVS